MSQYQLRAILFSDISGFSAIMGQSEIRCMKLIHLNRQIHKNAIRKYCGKFRKEMGDGVLATFPTISDAVYCAGEIQNSCTKFGINLKIGIHHGEVLVENSDIFGDVVNITSRIESLTVPGQIFVSKSVFNNIKNKPWISGRYIQTSELKNIDDPISIYSLSIEDHTRVQKNQFNFKYFMIAASISLMTILGYCSSMLETINYSWFIS